jgi:antitoxin HigA-1
LLLEEFLKPLGLTQTEVAERMQVPLKRLNAIIRGRKAVIPDAALRLERLFGMEAQFWLNLQLRVDLYRAMHSTAAQIRKLRPVPGIDEVARSTRARPILARTAGQNREERHRKEKGDEALGWPR